MARRSRAGRSIVVDASVARSAGVGRPPAPACLDALRALQEGGCSVVRSGAVTDEFRRHASGFARKWLANMIATGQSVASDGVWDGYSRLLSASAELEGDQPGEVAKDAHLLATAFATDRRVLSLDDAQRRLLVRLSPEVPELLELYWVHPVDPRAAPWLRDGAPDRPELTLAE